MDEEAIKYGYTLFTKDGYNGTEAEFRDLMATNQDAVNVAYGLFKSDGYTDSQEDFQSLVGYSVKKKEDTESGTDGSQEDGTTSQGSEGWGASSRPAFKAPEGNSLGLPLSAVNQIQGATKLDVESVEEYEQMQYDEANKPQPVQAKPEPQIVKPPAQQDVLTPEQPIEEFLEEKKITDTNLLEGMPQDLQLRISLEDAATEKNGEIKIDYTKLSPETVNAVKDYVLRDEKEDGGYLSMPAQYSQAFLQRYTQENQVYLDQQQKQTEQEVTTFNDNARAVQIEIFQLRNQGRTVEADALEAQLKARGAEINQKYDDVQAKMYLNASLDLVANTDYAPALVTFYENGANQIAKLPEMLTVGATSIAQRFMAAANPMPGIGFNQEQTLAAINREGMTESQGLMKKTDPTDKNAAFVGDVLGQIGLVVGSAALGGTPLAIGSAFGMSADEMYREAKANGLGESDALNLSLAYGAISAPLEMWGASRGIAAITGSSLRKRVINYVSKEGLKTIGKDQATDIVRFSLTPIIKDVVKEGIAEGLQEGSQYVLSKTLAETYNLTKEENDPEFEKADVFSEQFFRELGDNIIYGVIGGAVGGTAVNVGAVNFFTGSDYGKIEKMLLDDKQFIKLQGQVNNLQNSGVLDEQQALNTLFNLNVMREAAQAIPTNFTAGQKKAAFELIAEKKGLEQQMEGKDPSLVEQQKNRIAEIDAALKQVAEGTYVRPREEKVDSEQKPAQEPVEEDVITVFRSGPEGSYYAADPQQAKAQTGEEPAQYTIDSKNVMDLDEWNKRYEEEGGVRVQKDQPVFMIHDDMIKSEWDIQLTMASKQVGSEFVNEFLDALDKADAVKGKDLGHADKGDVYYVKNKEVISKQDDTKNKVGLPSEVQVGEESVQEKPDQIPSTAEIETSGTFQKEVKNEVQQETKTELREESTEAEETQEVKSLNDLAKLEPDKVEKWLDKAIEATSTKGKAFDATLAIPMKAANASLKIVKAAYKAGKTIAEAIQAGVDYLKQQGHDVKVEDFTNYVINRTTSVQKTAEDVKVAIEAYKQNSREKYDAAVGELKTKISEIKYKAKSFKDRKRAAVTVARDMVQAMKKGGIKSIPSGKVEQVLNQINSANTEKSYTQAINDMVRVLSKVAVTETEKARAADSLKKAKAIKKRAEKGGYGRYSGLVRQLATIPRDELSPELQRKYDKVVDEIHAGTSSMPQASTVMVEIIDSYEQPTKVVDEDADILKELKREDAIAEAQERDYKPDEDADFTEAEKDVIETLQNASDEVIAELSDAELRALPNIDDAIKASYLPTSATNIAISMRAEENADNLATALEKAFAETKKRIKGFLTNPRKLNPTARMRSSLENALTLNLDSQLGLKGDVISSILRPFELGFERYKSEEDIVKAGLSRIYKSYFKGRKSRRVADTKVMMYAIQKQYESNPDSKVTHSLDEFYEATMGTSGLKDQYREQVGDDATKIVEDVYSELGGKTADKIWQSMSSGERKLYEYMSEALQDQEWKVEKIKTTDRGEIFDRIEDYFSYPILMDKSRANEDLLENLQKGVMSVKAGVIRERQGKPGRIQFSASTSFMNAIRQVNKDYYLGEAIKVEGKTLRRLEKKLQDSEASRLGVIFKDVVENQRRLLLEVNRDNYSKVTAELMGAAYRYYLGTVKRLFTEGGANFIKFGMKDLLNLEGSLLEIIKSAKNRKQVSDVIRNVGSAQMRRLLEGATFGGYANVEANLNTEMDLDFSDRNRWDKLAAGLKWIGSPSKKIAEAVNKSPDRFFGRGAFMYEFKRTFKQETGKEVDMEKLASGDKEYMRENKAAIDKARRVADDKLGNLLATTNTAQKSFNQLNAEQRGNALDKIRYFMLNFILAEGQGVQRAIINEGGKGLKTAVPIMASHAAYGTLYEAMSLLFLKIVIEAVDLVSGDDEEEMDVNVREAILRDKTIERGVTNALAEAIILRHLNGVQRIPANILIEIASKNFGEGVYREEGEEYNRYKSLAYSPIDVSRLSPDGTIAEFARNLAPIAAPTTIDPLKSFMIAIKENDPDEEKMNDKQRYFALKGFLTLAGGLGMIPRDIRDGYVYYQNRHKILTEAKPQSAPVIKMGTPSAR